MLPLDTSTNTNPSGKTSIKTTSVAFTRAVLFTTIVKLTKVLLPINVMFAVLLTVKTTGTTSTVSLALTMVVFSSQ